VLPVAARRWVSTDNRCIQHDNVLITDLAHLYEAGVFDVEPMDELKKMLQKSYQMMN
jgi:hypothetical protein